MPKKKKPIDKASLVKRYGQYIKHRESDADIPDIVPQFSDLPKKFKTKERNIREMVKDAAVKYGIRPEILFSSLTEEGLRQLVQGGESTGDPMYPIDGFTYFGLDHFTD